MPKAGDSRPKRSRLIKEGVVAEHLKSRLVETVGVDDATALWTRCDNDPAVIVENREVDGANIPPHSAQGDAQFLPEERIDFRLLALKKPGLSQQPFPEGRLLLR